MSVLFSTKPISRRYTLGPAPVLIGRSPKSRMVGMTELTELIRVKSPIRTLPAGEIRFPLFTAWTTSSGDMWYARIRSGSTWTTTVRAFSPKGGGADTPGSVANIGRTRNRAKS